MERQIKGYQSPLKESISLKTGIFLLSSWSKCLVRQPTPIFNCDWRPVLASGEHVTGGLVAARSLASARGLLTAHVWVGGTLS